MKYAVSRREGADITLTPLIDILFIVLLFLVLTATFTEQTMLRIALPGAATGERAPADEGTLRILVDADGNLFVDGEVRSLDEVGARLLSIANGDEVRVSVSADERAAHGRVIAVVDLVRQAGIYRLDIDTLAARDGVAP